MPEANNILFSYKEVAEALLRKTNIHEGLWGIYIEFGIGGANVSPSPEEELRPAAIVPILRLGLQKFDAPSNLTVDASKVNPKKPKAKAKKK